MEKAQREKIVHKYLENPGASNRSIAKELKISYSTVTDVLKRYKATLSIERKPGSGLNQHKRKPDIYKQLVSACKKNSGLRRKI